LLDAPSVSPEGVTGSDDTQARGDAQVFVPGPATSADALMMPVFGDVGSAVPSLPKSEPVLLEKDPAGDRTGATSAAAKIASAEEHHINRAAVDGLAYSLPGFERHSSDAVPSRLETLEDTRTTDAPFASLVVAPADESPANDDFVATTGPEATTAAAEVLTPYVDGQMDLIDQAVPASTIGSGQLPDTVSRVFAVVPAVVALSTRTFDITAARPARRFARADWISGHRIRVSNLNKSPYRSAA